MKNNFIITIIVAVVVGALGFFGGMKYQQSKSPRFGNQQFGANMMGRGQRQGQNGFRPTAGEIINADDKSITVKLQNGSTKIIFVSDKTQINKAATATKADLKTGERVIVFGQENTDGSVTAQNIQLNPQTGMMRNR